MFSAPAARASMKGSAARSQVAVADSAAASPVAAIVTVLPKSAGVKANSTPLPPLTDCTVQDAVAPVTVQVAASASCAASIGWLKKSVIFVPAPEAATFRSTSAGVLTPPTAVGSG